MFLYGLCYVHKPWLSKTELSYLILTSFFFLSWTQVTPEGTFLDVRTIGRFCYEDDLLTLSAVYTEAQAESQPGFPRLYTDKTINSLKHRLLVYLWRRAEQDGSATAKRRYTPFFIIHFYLWFLLSFLYFHLSSFCTYSHGGLILSTYFYPSQCATS